ncbi:MULTISPECIES: DUF1707 domain-containing protein [unclassified Nocardia]|uniref:DUF1707 SHOCT-like domain-containing protein n=1 Tax=unclassified Nocardia TaxID=2637762 RepID=UPI0024A8CE35|nr:MULTISPECIES: DUF1707 domain-containing protein [unclassified Nocardia]
MAEPPDIRIGTAEREEAMRRLSDHFAAGRLSVAEFDERSAIVAAAVTRGDLEQVFTDLPAPVSLEKQVPAERGFRLPAGVAQRAMPVVTILALILFLVTQQWWFFLAIPLAGALLFGDRRGHRYGHGRWH